MTKTKLGLIVLALVLLVAISSKLFSGPFKQALTFSFSFQSEKLNSIVSKNTGKIGEYTVYIEELAPEGEIYALRSSDAFPAASLYKVYLLAAVLKKIEDGPSTSSGLKLEDGVTAEKSHLIEVLGNDEFGIQDLPDQVEFTVDEALTRVGRISDNFASLMLAEAVGWEKIQSMADSMGAKNTKVYPPPAGGGLIQTSAEDIALFFKKLHRREIVSSAVSEQIIKYLSLNQINDRIPAGGGKVIHKTGELPRVRHDAGIVDLGNGRAYIIVLMSKDLQYEDEGVETLAKISKDVYEYFKRK